MIQIQISKINSKLKSNDFTLTQEVELYDRQLQDVFDNPRQYLDNLNFLTEYKVRWKDYRYNTPVLPYKYTFYGKTSIPL